jgi:hypothetical protein
MACKYVGTANSPGRDPCPTWAACLRPRRCLITGLNRRIIGHSDTRGVPLQERSFGGREIASQEARRRAGHEPEAPHTRRQRCEIRKSIRASGLPR